MGNRLLQNDRPPQGGPRNIGPLMMRFVLVFLLAIGTAAAQPAKKQDSRDRQMSREDRQRMREDMRDAYRDRDRQERPQRSQQMTAEERVKLRRDIEDANRNLKR
jgi:hypothetical protein